MAASPLTIPEEELEFSFSRSSGPGGQNVNKVNSKVTLRWIPSLSTSIPEAVKKRFLAKFASRLTKNGELVLQSDEYRDQPRNRQDCIDKLHALIEEVRKPPTKRIPTKPSKAAKAKRVDDKKKRAQLKANRKIPKY